MNVSITLSADTADLERFAAAELRRYVQALFTPLASVARDMSDLGAIASINEFGDRPLRARLELLERNVPGSSLP